MTRQSKSFGAGVEDAAIAAAIATNFEGDASLYAAFTAVCALQFPLDIECGDAACVGGDLAQLGRLAHDLKSALGLLGLARGRELAAQVEALAAAHDRAAAERDWRALTALLPRLRSAGACGVDIG